MPSPDGGLVPIVFALLWVHPCRASADRATLWTCGSPKGTQHDGPGSVCCLYIALGVGVDRRRACPHRRDVGSWCMAGAMMSRQSWEQWFCEVVCVCGNRGRRAHIGHPDGRGGLGG